MEKTEEKECVTAQPGTFSKYTVKFGLSGERRTPIVRWKPVMGRLNSEKFQNFHFKA